MVAAVVAIMLQKELGQAVTWAESDRDLEEASGATTTCLIVLLSRGVLENPRVAVATTLADEAGAEVLPLNFDPAFTFPSTDWYESLVGGQLIPEADPGLLGLPLEAVADSYKRLFTALSLRFTPHGSETVQKAEISEIAVRMLLTRVASSRSSTPMSKKHPWGRTHLRRHQKQIEKLLRHLPKSTSMLGLTLGKSSEEQESEDFN